MKYWIIIFFPFFSCAQTLTTKNKKAIALYNEADNFRVRGQFDQAVRLLKQAIDKDKKFEEAYFRMALTYKNRGDLPNSTDYYEKGLVLTPYPTRQKIYYYALTENYLRSGKYEQAKTNADKFLSIEKADKQKTAQAACWKSQAEYGWAHHRENLGYRVWPLNDTVNAYPMQYFPTITADGQSMIFTVRYGRAHDDNEDIFISAKENDKWMAPVSISSSINSDYREGACSISADGRHLVFTICGPRGCDLYESKKNGDAWSKPTNLGPNINTMGWEAQPSLSADGSELYFVSDRKGGLGGYDIWYSQKDSAGKWMKAKNAGKPINTSFDEIAPYIHVNNHNLFFASNGLPGFGGYDIYSSEKMNNQWQEPKNLGAPLNDFEDQYSFVVTSDGATAYYSREEGVNQSKIYQAFIPEDLRVHYRGNVVKGVVSNSQTQKPMKARVELFDLRLNQKTSTFTSDSLTGNYLIVIPGKSEYALHVAETGYLFYSLHFNYEEKDQDRPVQINIVLQPIIKNAVTVLNNIFFEFDKYAINPKSLTELGEVVKFLTENPSIKVEISGHTDDVGNENYNQVLSQKRAQSVVDYLISKGIESKRLTRAGIGSKKPIRPNDTEENRQLNRRIEFRIL
ncbi:MAG: Outer membrane protein A precursor [Cytophagales bacterium]|jgi:outer membrane protein OmpA-like peptidoglycan-associated protein/tetratricopeptide (TPR) repeat protein|nr:OmpA family protein [Bacteroidota bacterium]MBS1982383.1 OmpA family protein [Bacteroidota bacterium]WHZ06685.1 MAG: Outer membrane protein A precursor [Cytophagales bacterium]